MFEAGCSRTAPDCEWADGGGRQGRVSTLRGLLSLSEQCVPISSDSHVVFMTAPTVLGVCHAMNHAAGEVVHLLDLCSADKSLYYLRSDEENAQQGVDLLHDTTPTTVIPDV